MAAAAAAAISQQQWPQTFGAITQSERMKMRERKSG